MSTIQLNHTFFCWTDASWKTSFANKLKKEEWAVKTWLKDILQLNWFDLNLPFEEYFQLEMEYVKNSVWNLVFDRCSIDFLVYNLLMIQLNSDEGIWEYIVDQKYGDFLTNFVAKNWPSNVIYLSTSFDVLKKRMNSRDIISNFDKLLLNSPETFSLYKWLFEMVVVKLKKENIKQAENQRLLISHIDTSKSVL